MKSNYWTDVSKELKIVLAVIALFAGNPSLPVAMAQAPALPKSLTKVQWRQDLHYFARELPMRHKNAFHLASREQFEHAVAQLDADIPLLQDYQIMVRMLRITAMIGDAHTYIHLPQTLKIYPLGCYWFGPDMRVTRAAPEHKRALGSRVLKIGDTSIQEVNSRVRSLLSQDENEWFYLSN